MLCKLSIHIGVASPIRGKRSRSFLKAIFVFCAITNPSDRKLPTRPRRWCLVPNAREKDRERAIRDKIVARTAGRVNTISHVYERKRFIFSARERRAALANCDGHQLPSYLSAILKSTLVNERFVLPREATAHVRA